MQKAKNYALSFSNRNLKATKEQFLFYFFKNNDMQCIKDKTLIYMHIKQIYVLFFFFYKCKKKLPTNKSMQMTRTKKKELYYTTTKQTLECPKVSLNPIWKETK